MFQNTIRLFWWNEKIIQGKSKENYGDLIGKYLVEKISNKKVTFAWPKKFSFFDFFKPIYVTVGSIIHNVNHKCIVWGSGIINQDIKIRTAKFLAVRGPQTKKYLQSLGHEVPEVYGDPAILIPWFFNLKVEKKYKTGIVPHYNDYEMVRNWYKHSKDIVVIDMMTNDVESKTVEFLECERIISSSLHGIIVAHAYNIPAVWQKFSDKIFGNDIKYQDYMESIQLDFYKSEIKITPFSDEEIEKLFQRYPSLPNPIVMENMRKELMEVCPFKRKKS